MTWSGKVSCILKHSSAILVKFNENFLQQWSAKTGKFNHRKNGKHMMQKSMKIPRQSSMKFLRLRNYFLCVSMCFRASDSYTRCSISSENIIKTTFIIYDVVCDVANLLSFNEIILWISALCYQIMESWIKHTLEILWWEQQKLLSVLKILYWFIYYLLDHYAQTASLLCFLLIWRNFIVFVGVGNKTRQFNQRWINNVGKAPLLKQSRKIFQKRTAREEKINLRNQIYFSRTNT